MHIVYRDKEWTLDRTVTVHQLLKYIHVLPENVLVVRNGQLIPEDEKLHPGDEVKVVAVISGG